MKRVWIVWLQYPGEERRFSAAFNNKKAATDYAQPDRDAPVSYTAFVTEEPVFSTADDAV